MIHTEQRNKIPIENDRSVLAARQRGREIAAALGFSRSDQTMIATTISELARNIVSYVGRGVVEIAQVKRAGQKGVEIIARDEGPGIPDIDQAMQDGFTTGGSLGLGLPGTQRMMDELSIESTPGEGTTVTTRKWLRQPRRRRRGS